jgi:hypothetical protein
MGRLPERRLDDFRWLQLRVGPSSTINVAHNVYSVHSRLKGETVRVKLYGEYFELFYGQKKIERIPRLRGQGRHFIQYRHIIETLVRKPGAFENYRYRDDLFPTIRFRMAYDYLRENRAGKAAKEYLKILYLAARETESGVDKALRWLFENGRPISPEAVKEMLETDNDLDPHQEVNVEEVSLSQYDELLRGWKTQEVAYEQQS